MGSPMESPDGQSRSRRGPRVSKACDYCRGKKLKCDGDTPCSRCAKREAICTYNYIEKKRSPRIQKPMNSVKSASKLAELIQTAVDDHNEDREEVEDEDEEDDDNYNDDNYPTNDSNDNNDTKQRNRAIESRLDRLESMIELLLQRSLAPVKGPYSHQQIEQPDNLLEQMEQTVSPDDQNYNGQYFGSHCSFSIFSPKGLSYISQRCEDPHAMDRVVRMLRDVYSVLYSQYKKRVEPAPVTDVIPVPLKDLSDKLVDAYVSSSLYVNSILDEDEIRDCFNNYYTNEARGAQKRELRQSDYSILHAICGLGAMSLLEKLSKSPKADINELEFYRQVEEKHIMCALYYFHRLTIYGDGIHGVKSILLLISYIESSLIPDTDYLLVSSVIRFGQSIGLHRRESMYGLPEGEIIKRKRIWLNCYVLDKDLCLKSGKSPIINEQDMSSLAKEEHSTFLEDIKAKASLKLRISMKNLNLDNPNHFKEFLRTLVDTPFGVARYFENLRLKIARISSSGYLSLFSATALDGKTKRNVMTIVQGLNDQFYLFKESIPKFIRPGFKIALPSINSDVDKAFIYSQVVRLQFSYHLNVMNINRIGLNKEWKDGEVCANLCLESAREIMRISQGINATDAHLYLCSLFVILSANVTLLSYIVENPRNPSVKSDLLLMSKTSDLQRMKYIELQYDPINLMKFLSIIYIIKNFIKIGLDFYNKVHNDINYKSPNDQEDNFEITNNRSEIVVLEAELDKVFEQIELKHGFAKFVKPKSRVIKNGAVLNDDFDPAQGMTQQPDTSDVNQAITGTQPAFASRPVQVGNSTDENNAVKPGSLPEFLTQSNGGEHAISGQNEAQISINPSDPGISKIEGENVVGQINEETMINDLLNGELLDMSYFSQPLFNIPNFLLDN